MGSKALVIGALGSIGSPLFQAYQKERADSVGTHRQAVSDLRKLDLIAPDLKFLEKETFDCAFIAAAIANISQCEREPKETYRCNVSGPLELGEKLCSKGILPVFFSTDYVFDGKSGLYNESSPLSPLNEYGRQKAELERELERRFTGMYLLIRLSKVYGREKADGTLIDEMAASLAMGKKIRAARDQIFNPIWVGDVVEAVKRLERGGARGVYQISGDETVSRFDLALGVCQALGVSPDLVIPISLKDLQEPFLRPSNTSLSNQKMRERIGFKMVRLDETVKRISESYKKGIG